METTTFLVLRLVSLSAYASVGIVLLVALSWHFVNGEPTPPNLILASCLYLAVFGLL